MTNYEKLNLLISSLSLLSVFIILWQAFLIKKQIVLDHERGRRELSIELMFKWIRAIEHDMSIARKIAERLNKEECQNIYNMDTAYIPESCKTLLERLLDNTIKVENNTIKVENNTIKISDADSSLIRSLILNYLNALETVLTGWRLEIVDKEIIEEEFSYLYDPKTHESVLDTFRSVVGIHNYLSIKEFCKTMREKYEKKCVKKNKLI